MRRAYEFCSNLFGYLGRWLTPSLVRHHVYAGRTFRRSVDEDKDDRCNARLREAPPSGADAAV